MTFVNGKYTITPKSVEVTWSAEAIYTFDGTDRKATVTATFTDIDGNVRTLTVSITTAGMTEFLNAGTYDFMATTTNGNYALTNATRQYVMAQKALTEDMVGEVDGTFTFNGGEHKPVVTVADGELITDGDFEIFYTSNVNAGVATLTVTAKGNYTGMITRSFTIGAMSVEVEWTHDAGYVFTGSDQSGAVTASYTNVNGAKVMLTVAVRDGKVFLNAGDYTFEATGGDSNYVLTETELALTIAKATVEIPGLSGSYTYTGEELTANVAENAAYTIAGDRQTNAGEYDVTLTLNDTANYEWADGTTDALTLKWNIAKAVYDMSGVKFDNATVTYNGESHSLEVTGLPAGVTVTYEGNGQTEAGTYTVTAKFSGNVDNYELIEDMTATLTIEAEAETGGCSCGGAITDVTTIVLISVGVLLFGAVFAVKKLRNKKK